MEREIVLSSYSVKNKDNNKPENFVTDFVRPIILDSNHEYMIGLNRIINMSFTWFNINAGYKNQLIGYSEDSGSTFTNISFPAGVWNYTDINQHIQEVTVIKQANKEDEYPINLKFNETTFRVTITMKENSSRGDGVTSAPFLKLCSNRFCAHILRSHFLLVF